MPASFMRAAQWFEESCAGAGYTLELFLRTAQAAGEARRRRPEVLHQLFLCTFGSMGVVFIIALFTGMIVSMQSGLQLQRYGQQQMLGFIVSAGMCREMGPVFTAFALAAMVGSTYAAQIATMKVSEEIDALEVMSINPIRFLVVPRVAALTISAVVLTIYANVIGIIGGALVSKSFFRVDFDIFFQNARDVLALRDIFGGLLKSLIFGATIAVVACSQGLRAEHGAAGVGRATLRAVVACVIFILVFDYFLTWMLY